MTTDGKTPVHPQTILNRLDTYEQQIVELLSQLHELREYLDRAYRMIGVPYPGTVAAEEIIHTQSTAETSSRTRPGAPSA